MKAVPNNRILVINTAFLGDAILGTPLVRALKELYPNALIDIVLIPQTAAIYKHNPHINEIYLFDKRNRLKRMASFWGLIGVLRKNRYRMAISTHVHLSTTMIMQLSSIPMRVGFRRLKGLTAAVTVEKGLQVVKRNLKLMRPFTKREFTHHTELFWDQTTQDQSEAFIQEHQLDTNKLIALAPGSVWATKRWLPEHFAQVVSSLTEAGFQCVLVGGKEDKALCAMIITESKTDAVNAAGSFNILGSAALIKSCRLLISNDSAPLHLANAVGTKVLAVFGPTVKRFGFFPIGAEDRVLEIDLDCRPCGKHGHQKCPLKHFRCMREILPEMVINGALEMLA